MRHLSVAKKTSSLTGQDVPIIRRFFLLEEPRRYAETIAQYWPLILSIGLLFGWLLSFPMMGPLLGAFTPVSFSPTLAVSLFLTGHITGLMVGGVTGYFLRRYSPWFSLSAISCTILSFIVGSISGLELPSFAIMGLFSGLAIISWGIIFTDSVLTVHRARTFALGAVLANLILYLNTFLVNGVDINLLIYLTGLLPLSMPLVLILHYRRANPVVLTSSINRVKPGTKTVTCWPFLPFIFTIYALGGLMYYVLGNLATSPTPVLASFGLIPYILLLFVAGSLGDNSGRRVIAAAGAIIVGIGFMTVGLFSGVLQYVTIQSFIVGGFALVDTFTWVLPSDLSSGRRAPLNYAAILSVNVLAILTGLLLTQKLAEVVSGSEIVTVSIAGLLSLISVALLFRLRMPSLSPEQSLKTQSGAVTLFTVLPELGFTARESEIVELLVAGKSTPEILEKLVIAPDTLKTHLRNIYHKAGVRNRLGLTIALMNKPEPRSKTGL